MDHSALVNLVVEESLSKPPACSVCGGKMHVLGWSNGKEEYACSKIKPSNQAGDTRPFDPNHYEKSRVKIPFGVDQEKLRTKLAEAFGQVEAETEKRIRDEYAAMHKQAAQEKTTEKPAEPVPSEASKAKPRTTKGEKVSELPKS